MVKTFDGLGQPFKLQIQGLLYKYDAGPLTTEPKYWDFQTIADVVDLEIEEQVIVEDWDMFNGIVNR